MEPDLVMLSPPCTAYSQKHKTDGYTRDPNEMLMFTVKAAQHQMYKGKYFVLEQLRHAKSLGKRRCVGWAVQIA